MPNCPVCGKQVQANTAYCPACGTNLNQASLRSSTQPGTYSPGSSYPAQPGGMPSTAQSHGHRKYVLAIIAALLIGLIVGGLVTNFFLIGPDVTDTTGTVILNTEITNQYHGVANHILFGSASTGNLSSAVSPPNHSYQVYLPIGPTYTVAIQWVNASNTQAIDVFTCTATPGSFTSSEANATQNFSC